MVEKDLGAMQAEKIWGNSQVFCAGRLVSGPDGRSAAATFLMVLVPSIVWQVVVGSWYTRRYGVLVALIAGLLAVASLTLLFATAFSDPGIMPRQKDYQEQWDPTTKSNRSKQPARYYDIILRGHPTKLKYCVTCNIYRPPRCTHCSVCENCVERFDHHCPWIGNCVGKRNYWLFYSFVSSTGCLNAYSLVTAGSLLAVRGQEIRLQRQYDTTSAFTETMREEPFTAALAIYCTLLVWFTVGLCLYHSYLIMTNQTTYEQIKGLYSGGSNPFHRGSAAANCSDVLCAPVRPRYFDGASGQLLWPKVAMDARRERLTAAREQRTAPPASRPSGGAATPGAPRAGGPHMMPMPVAAPAGMTGESAGDPCGDVAGGGASGDGSGYVAAPAARYTRPGGSSAQAPRLPEQAFVTDSTQRSRKAGQVPQSQL